MVILYRRVGDLTISLRANDNSQRMLLNDRIHKYWYFL